MNNIEETILTTNNQQPITDNQQLNDCWNQVGVTGDRTCGELEKFIHCRNCPVYSAAGRGLLEREVPSGYLQEWTDLLAQAKDSCSLRPIDSTTNKSVEQISVVIFRIGVEWLALPANLFKEVTQLRTIHTLPHLSNEVLLGIVNIRGEILLSISLGKLLGLETKADGAQNMSPVVYPRMVVVEKEGAKWVFAVDEIYGIKHFEPEELQDTPVVIAKATETYTKSLLQWQDKQINYLDYELLFYTLNRRIM
ncbi:MAG: purine-binding chemotaxis protein CheW [Symploca sp. SIO1B1]|nr:purine-binding chemotaxis protein CheW [Symploca sp. SIO1C2]NER50867.1 purine-binding chemotaxis protein CheW [Symploca sp. SIO1A3]NER96421.1 purine-binding chemotaxis protein CheW [Symploca sp. SIO1B1]